MQVNDLSIEELRGKIRKKDGLVCWSCDKHKANDVHHLDGNHSNNIPSNLTPYCKRCHNEVHGISDNLTALGLVVQSYEDVQRMRIAVGNRIGAYEKLGYEVGPLYRLRETLRAEEESLSADIERGLRRCSIYEAWLRHVDGIGHKIAGKLVHHIGSIDKFPTVSSLWAYAGLHVVDGKAPRRIRGEKANWNQALKVVVVGLIPDQFVKLGVKNHALGRKLYDQYKAFYVNRDGGELSKLHIERRARRKLGKVFLSCLWTAWRELEGLPVTEPYAAKLEGHTHIIRPWDWVAGNKGTYDLRLELARNEQLELNW